jgi:hypothetical protein
VKSTPTTKSAQQPVKKPVASRTSDSDDSDDDKPTNKKLAPTKGAHLFSNYTLLITIALAF